MMIAVTFFALSTIFVCWIQFSMKTKGPTRMSCLAACAVDNKCRASYFSKNSQQCYFQRKMSQGPKSAEGCSLTGVMATKRQFPDEPRPPDFPCLEADIETMGTCCVLDNGYITDVKSSRTAIRWSGKRSRKRLGWWVVRASKSLRNDLSFWITYVKTDWKYHGNKVQFSILVRRDLNNYHSKGDLYQIDMYASPQTNQVIWRSFYKGKRLQQYIILPGEMSLGFLLDWPHKRLNVIDMRENIVIDTVKDMDMTKPYWFEIWFRVKHTRVKFSTCNNLALAKLAMKVLHNISNLIP